MGKEIERKFLVKPGAWEPQGAGIHFKQGYLNSQKERVVRVRIEGDEGEAHDQGPDDGRDPLGVRIRHSRSRTRRSCSTTSASSRSSTSTATWRSHGGKTWEIDVFHGDNDGLVVAEIELRIRGRETFDAAGVGGRGSLERPALLQLEPPEAPVPDAGGKA